MRAFQDHAHEIVGALRMQIALLNASEGLTPKSTVLAPALVANGAGAVIEPRAGAAACTEI